MSPETLDQNNIVNEQYQTETMLGRVGLYSDTLQEPATLSPDDTIPHTAHELFDEYSQESEELEELEENPVVGFIVAGTDIVATDCTKTNLQFALVRLANDAMQDQEYSERYSIIQQLYADAQRISEPTLEITTKKYLLVEKLIQFGSIIDDQRPSWQHEGECNGLNFEQIDHVFYPSQGQSIKEARKICAPCPVKQECLDYALEKGERFGIWGGLTTRERNRILKKQKLNQNEDL
jgi:WhiB family transcriptional regulator, redox-sensing transcriptional regulator